MRDCLPGEGCGKGHNDEPSEEGKRNCGALIGACEQISHSDKNAEDKKQCKGPDKLGLAIIVVPRVAVSTHKKHAPCFDVGINKCFDRRLGRKDRNLI